MLGLAYKSLLTDKGCSTTAGGAKVEIPTEHIDILFAGCSCVDYSNMNMSKPKFGVPSLDRHLTAAAIEKGSPVGLDKAFLEDVDSALPELISKTAGESARTFFSAIKLVSKLRPKTVMLENVLGAPWDLYTNSIFPKLGYVAGSVKLDTKHFYLPQTRKRGYLIAVDAQRIGTKTAKVIADEWCRVLVGFKRRASAPVSAFLGSPDDPATIQAKADMEAKAPYPNTDWGFSSLRHFDERRRHGLLLDENPFSLKAMRNGRLIYASYPSHSWKRLWDRLGARVVDSMDILFAAGRKYNVDIGYKTMLADVSQNIDRSNKFLPVGSEPKSREVNLQLGIIGCITPSGIPVLTDSMRPVTGIEALALQGLPADELVISTETQAQLRDLAGNAMTVTVVGAATLILLDSISKAAKEMLDPLDQSTALDRDLYLGSGLLTDRLPEPRVADDIATVVIEDLLTVARRMVRVCFCLQRNPREKRFICTHCGTLACTACYGNPTHHYARREDADSKRSSENDAAHLRSLLPKTVLLPVPLVTVNHGLQSVIDPTYKRVVSEVLTSNPVYYLDAIKVTEVVTVCYNAINSSARLVISPNSVCCWYIYTQHESVFKFDLDQPIARGQYSSDSPSTLHWSVWALGQIDLTVTFEGDHDGSLVVGNLAFAGGHGIQPDPSLHGWKETVESRVHGRYLHRPRCGTAGDALRVKQNPATDAKVYLMWDSGSLRHQAEDHFVWAETMRRTLEHEYREILLHAKPTSSGWNIELDPSAGPTTIDVFWPGYWSSPPCKLVSPELDRQALTWAPAQICWGLARTLCEAPCHADGFPVTYMPTFAALHASLDRFPLKSRERSKMDPAKTDGCFYVAPATQRDAFLRRFAFLSSQVCSSTAPADLALFEHLKGNWLLIDACRDCSVAPPEISFYTKMEQKGGEKMKYTHVVIEDPDEAARFEKQFLDLPRSVAVAACLAPDCAALDMRIMLQPKTLASRAFGYLVQAHRTVPRGRQALDKHAKTYFTVKLDFAFHTTLNFAPFRDSVTSCGEEFTVGIVPGLYVLGSDQPPRFRRGFSLRPSQRDAVHWMMQRERSPVDFTKVEIEEEVVRPLNMRVMGKAEWTNSFPYCSRGGVVAHEIGYGKTVVMLALHDYMREYDKDESIEDRRKVDEAWRSSLLEPLKRLASLANDHPIFEAESFFVHLSATLVVVPRHITKQWAKEAARFLGLRVGREVIVIKTAKDFYTYELDKLRNAEMIIVSTGIFGATFLDRLRALGGRGGDCPKGLFGRTLELWYQRALQNHRTGLAYYLAGLAAGSDGGKLERELRKDFLPALIIGQQAEHDVLVQKQVPEMDRSFYKKGGAGKGVAKADMTRADVTSGLETWSVQGLHSCSFARIIWDECSYDGNSTISLFVTNAIANSKWLISGTPKLFGLDEVCRIASTFGIHVARAEPRMMPGLPSVIKGPKLEPMSKSEQFHVFSSSVKSAVLAYERHRQAQGFVAATFRANTLETGLEVKFEEHVRPVTMTTRASVRYHMLTQAVLDAGYDYFVLPSYARNAVAVTGCDLDGKSGLEAARMFLGIAACDTDRDGSSVQTLQTDLQMRAEELRNQLKFIWDKMMWLRHWIIKSHPDKFGDIDSEKPPNARQAKEAKDWNGPTGLTLLRVNFLCDRLRRALDSGDFSDFAGADLFVLHAASIAGLPKDMLKQLENTRLDLDALRVEWTHHFTDGWIGRFREEKALNTWLDFFDLDGAYLDTLTPAELRILSEELCWLVHKVPGVGCQRDLNGLPTAEFFRRVLSPNFKVSRAVPHNIAQLLECDQADIAGRTAEELKRFILACIAEKPKKKTWQAVKDSYKFDGIPSTKGSQSTRARLQNRARELNLRFHTNTTSDRLKQIIWSHEQGVAVAASYRDGRAPPASQDFTSATNCHKGSKEDREKAATHELKSTMVHLLKTIEDLNVTLQEARFVPKYISLASAGSGDSDPVLSMLCDGCSATLESADTSFLVVACGHLLCHQCRSGRSSISVERFYCPAQHCTAFIRQRPVLRCSQICGSANDTARSKADSVVNLIKKEIHKDDFVILFAQYGPLINALDKALRDANIRFTNLAAIADSKIADKLEDFKAGRAGQVLLLDIESDTSAGSNLTIASHVIFANPFVHSDKEFQARTVRQARGRCIRLGQTKKVNVYHMMVPGTIEEESLRAFARQSKDVDAFFKAYDQVPWWLDEKDAAASTDAKKGEKANVTADVDAVSMVGNADDIDITADSMDVAMDDADIYDDDGDYADYYEDDEMDLDADE
jgi:site-specific DNA-cytosine methylase